jgi:hypothetical protein
MKGIVFLPEMKTIGGARAIDRNIIAAKDGRDLDKVLASAGTIQVIPKEALRPFGTIRKTMETSLLAKGTRFFGGYLVEESTSDQVHADLEKLRDKLLQSRDDLVANLPSLIQQRIDEAPEWEDVIRSLAPTVEDIQDAITFSWIRTPVNLEDPEVQKALKGDPLAIRIAREMAQLASTHQARNKGTGRSKGVVGVSVLRAIQTKAKALAFVDGRFSGLDTALGQVIHQAEQAAGGPLQVGASLVVRGLLESLRDPKNILDAGEAGEFNLPDFTNPFGVQLEPEVTDDTESTPVSCAEETQDSSEDDPVLDDSEEEDLPIPEAVSTRVPVSAWAF